MEYNILDVCLHHTDYKKDEIEEANDGIEDVSSYIKSVIDDTLKNDNTRFYKIKRETTEVVNLIGNTLRNSEITTENSNDDVAVCTQVFLENAYNIAKCLLDAERKGNERARNLKNEVKKGSLIQARVSMADNYTIYVLAKIDYTKILDREGDTIEGLPLEQKALKTGIFKYDEEYNIEEIMLYDSQGNVSEYWYSDFFNLEKMSSDDENTLHCFNSIDKMLRKTVMPKSPSDYWEIYNGVVGYFKQNEEFKYDDMVKKVFESHEVIDSNNLNKEELIIKIKQVPNLKSSKFEKNFTIKDDMIKKKRQRTIAIRQEIDLIYKNSLDNLKEVMYSEKMDNEKYVLKIIVDEKIYNQFKRNI